MIICRIGLVSRLRFGRTGGLWSFEADLPHRMSVSDLCFRRRSRSASGELQAPALPFRLPESFAPDAKRPKRLFIRRDPFTRPVVHDGVLKEQIAYPIALRLRAA